MSAFLLRLSLCAGTIVSSVGADRIPARGDTPDFYLRAEPPTVYACSAPACRYMRHSVTIVVGDSKAWPAWPAARGRFSSHHYSWKGQLTWNNYDQALEATVELAPRIRGTEAVNAKVKASWGSKQSESLSTVFSVVGSVPHGQIPVPAARPPPPVLTTTPRTIHPETVGTHLAITFHATPHDSSGPHAAVLHYRWSGTERSVPMSWTHECKCYTARVRIAASGNGTHPPVHVSAVALITQPGNWRVTTSFVLRAQR